MFVCVLCIIMFVIVTMLSLVIVERADISSLVSSRFVMALMMRALATCYSVNAVLIYLMKSILASRCVLYLFFTNQVFFFCSVVMMLSSPCFIDDTVESMTWRTKNGKSRI